MHILTKKMYIFIIFFFNIIVPLILGTIIYILFRTESTYIFTFLKLIRIDNLVKNNIRQNFYILNNKTLYFIIFNMPNLLWTYALTSLLNIIWIKKSLSYYLILSILFVFIIIFPELLQKINFFPGQFDLMDLIASIIGFILSVILFNILNYFRRLNYD